MGVIDEIAVLVTARTKPFEQGMKDAANTTRKFNEGINVSTKDVTKLLTTLGLYQVALAAIKQPAELVRGIDRIQDVSDSFGLATDSVQVFELAAKTSRVEFDNLVLAVGKMEKKVSEASAGSTDAAQSFTDLGLNAKQLIGLRPEQVFIEVADAISKLPSPIQRARAAQELFGRGGTELVRILKLGSAGFAEIRKAAEEYGLVSASDVQQISELTVEASKLSFGLQQLQRSFLVAFGPFLEAAIQRTNKALLDFAKLLKLIRDPFGTEQPEALTKVGTLRARQEVVRPGNIEVGQLDKVKKLSAETEGYIARLRDAKIEAKKLGEEIAIAAEKRGLPQAAAEARKLQQQFANVNEELEKITARADIQNATDALVLLNDEIFNAASRLRLAQEAADAFATNLEKGLVPGSAEQVFGKFNQLQKGAVDAADALNAALKKRATFADSITQSLAPLRGKVEEPLAKLRELGEAMKIGGEIAERTRTPWEEFNRGVELARKAMRAGAITATQFIRELQRLREELNKKTELALIKPFSAEAFKILRRQAVSPPLDTGIFRDLQDRLDLEKKITEEQEKQRLQRVLKRDEAAKAPIKELLDLTHEEPELINSIEEGRNRVINRMEAQLDAQKRINEETAKERRALPEAPSILDWRFWLNPSKRKIGGGDATKAEVDRDLFNQQERQRKLLEEQKRLNEEAKRARESLPAAPGGDIKSQIEDLKKLNDETERHQRLMVPAPGGDVKPPAGFDFRDHLERQSEIDDVRKLNEELRQRSLLPPAPGAMPLGPPSGAEPGGSQRRQEIPQREKPGGFEQLDQGGGPGITNVLRGIADGIIALIAEAKLSNATDKERLALDKQNPIKTYEQGIPARP